MTIILKRNIHKPQPEEQNTEKKQEPREREVDPYLPKPSSDHQSPLPFLDDNVLLGKH